MRDHLCLCGCGLNAASSSRSASPLAPSSHKRARMQSSPTLSTTLSVTMWPSQVASNCANHINATSSTSLGVDTLHGTKPFLSTSHITPPRHRRFTCSLFPFLAIVFYALVTTVVASANPTRTPAPELANHTSFSNLTTQPLPTSVPYPATETRNFQQLAAAAAAAAAASPSVAPPNHNINVQVSQPFMCENMNITFDPSHGKPPYTVMISIEDYWPVTISLPANYDDVTKDMWLYQYAVPSFTGHTFNPSLIVSVTDSTGLVANSSSFLTVNSPRGTGCPPMLSQSSFYFYTENAASMCQDYDIFWNGTYVPPITAIFLPELAPPIYVPAPLTATNNMSWQVAMEGGTRFVMSLGDSRAVNANGGVSKLNIVALNEYFSDACIAQSHYEHRLFAPSATASPASVFPDATSTVASLTTSRGMVATVTVIETIKNGRYVHGNGGGGLSSVGSLILIIVLVVGMGLIGVAVGWFCFRRRQKRRQNIRAWDLPNGDPSVPFSADPNMPIAPGVFGRSVTRRDSIAASTRAAVDRTSVSGTSNYDPVSLITRPLTHAPSTRASLRSWTSSALDHLHLATGAHPQLAPAAEDYALMTTASGAGFGVSPSEANGFSYGHHTRSLTIGTLSNGSREAWSPTDSIPRTLGFYSDDPHDHAAHPESRPQHRTGSRASSDEASTKSNRVGPGPTYRPDAASQAAYQDLLATNASPTSGVEYTLPFSATRTQPANSTISSTSRTHGWAEVSDGTTHSTRIVRHADAGLLMDDNDNGDELAHFGASRLMELPPQYDTIHPGTAPQQRPPHAQAPSNESPYASQPRSQRSHTHGLASMDISDAGSRPAEVHAADLVDENDDESAFWAH